MAVETERKFLIRLPDLDFVKSLPECRVRRIRQTYLIKVKKGLERRVRRIEEGERVTWVFTRKEKLTKLSRLEDDREITEEEYRAFYADADTELTKTRYMMLTTVKTTQHLKVSSILWRDLKVTA